MTNPVPTIVKIAESTSSMFTFFVEGAPDVQFPGPLQPIVMIVEKLRISFGDQRYQYMVFGGRLRTATGISNYTEKNLPANMVAPDWALPYEDFATCQAAQLVPAVLEG